MGEDGFSEEGDDASMNPMKQVAGWEQAGRGGVSRIMEPAVCRLGRDVGEVRTMVGSCFCA